MREISIPNLSVLREELKKRDIIVSAPTISRDVGQLNLLRTKGEYKLARYANSTACGFYPDTASVLRRSVLKIDTAQHMLVIRTRPGSAGQVGFSLNNRFFNGIVGAVAGHDTVLVVSETPQKAQAAKDRIFAEMG
jgi:transcriptional regulator of arginine metabolism